MVDRGFLFESDRYATDERDWLKLCLTEPHPHKPGEKFMYSNSNYYLLSCALHRAAGKRTGVIASREYAAGYEADKVWCAGAEGDADAIAHNLYRILREADEADTDVLYSEGFTAADSAAVFNRLYKAAGGCVTEAKEG